MKKSLSPFEHYEEAKKLTEEISRLKEKILLEYKEALKDKTLWAPRFYLARFLYNYRFLFPNQIEILEKAKTLFTEVVNLNPKFIMASKYIKMIEKELESKFISDKNLLENKANVYENIIELERKLKKFVIEKLKEKYGEDEGGWWVHSVPQHIRKEIAKQREEDSERFDFSKYFYLIELKEIIEKNWGIFGQFFSKSNNKKDLDWLIKCNTIRNIIARDRRFLQDDEKNFIEEQLKKMESLDYKK